MTKPGFPIFIKPPAPPQQPPLSPIYQSPINLSHPLLSLPFPSKFTNQTKPGSSRETTRKQSREIKILPTGAKMRMSCNGCRVLRKGCSENCSIRPCLQWIKSPEAQGHATVFLAKFYGRAGLMNLINSGPEHLRPGNFSYSIKKKSSSISFFTND